MKVIFVFATFLVALVYSQISDETIQEKLDCYQRAQTRIYESKIKELLEKLREQLKNGIPEKNIPPLDPLVLDNYNLKINEEVAKLDWVLSGKIEGLMGWEITNIKFSIAGFKFSFGFKFPQIKGVGTYNIDGTVANVLPVYGSGDYNVLADNLSINGTGKLGVQGSGEDQKLFLEKFSIAVSLQNLQFNVTGLMDEEELSSLISQLVSENVPDLLIQFQSQIDKVVSTKVTEIADKTLANMTISDILGMLKPKSQDVTYLLDVDCGL